MITLTADTFSIDTYQITDDGKAEAIDDTFTIQKTGADTTDTTDATETTDTSADTTDSASEETDSSDNTDASADNTDASADAAAETSEN